MYILYIYVEYMYMCIICTRDILNVYVCIVYVYILYIYNVCCAHIYVCIYLCMYTIMYVYAVVGKLSFLLRKAKLCFGTRCQEVSSHSFPLQIDLWMD